MLHTTVLDMAETVVTDDIDAFLTNAAWVILLNLPYWTIIGPKCCSTYPSLLTGIKLENTGSIKQSSTQSEKITNAMIGITKLVIEYY